MYIELKAKDGKVSKDQERWLNMLSAVGNAVCTCYGGDSAIRAIEKYIKSGL